MQAKKGMNRHQLREVGMTCLYQSFLLNGNIRQIVFENSESNEIDPFLYTITIDAMKYKDIYIQKINAVINKDWSFDRLGYVEQAILLMAKRSRWPRNIAMMMLTSGSTVYWIV